MKTGIFNQNLVSRDTLNYYQELNMHSLYFEIFDPKLVNFLKIRFLDIYYL